MARRTYRARDDDPMFDDVSEQSWEFASERLATDSFRALDSIDSHGATWKSVRIYVEVPRETEQIAERLRAHDIGGGLKFEVEPKGSVLALRIDTIGDTRDDAAVALADSIRALEEYYPYIRSWAWDLEFESESSKDDYSDRDE